MAAIQFLQKRKYEVLLVALLLHLFIGLVLTNLEFYTKVIWPVNMLILGIASVGVFIEKGRWKKIIKNILLLLVLALPIALPFFKNDITFMLVLNIVYVIFFALIFLEVVRFLIRPSYINADIITASACGYLLLLEISVFLMQFFYYNNTASFKGIDQSATATVYIDIVYFCSITLTSIGFGDITPSAHYTKLATSLFGIAGQFYLVVLVGILISKFSSISEKK